MSHLQTAPVPKDTPPEGSRRNCLIRYSNEMPHFNSLSQKRRFESATMEVAVAATCKKALEVCRRRSDPNCPTRLNGFVLRTEQCSADFSPGATGKRAVIEIGVFGAKPRFRCAKI